MRKTTVIKTVRLVVGIWCLAFIAIALLSKNFEVPMIILYGVLAIIAIFCLAPFSFWKKREDPRNNIFNTHNSDNKQYGYIFEQDCAELLRRTGFQDVEVTKKSHDKGVDIFAKRGDVTFAIQCKFSDNPVGRKAVQEVVAGRTFFRKHVGVVMTNSTFTQEAIETAKGTETLLWDGEKLKEFE